MKRNLYTIGLCALIFLVWGGCVEPFAITSENYKEYLVIDGHVTTDLARHQVRISTTSYINQKKFIAEEGAVVTISDDKGKTFPLTETSPGTYRTVLFAGIPGNSYRLSVTRAN